MHHLTWTANWSCHAAHRHHLRWAFRVLVPFFSWAFSASTEIGNAPLMTICPVLFHGKRKRQIALLPTSHASGGLVTAYCRRHQNSQYAVQASWKDWLPWRVGEGGVHNQLMAYSHILLCLVECEWQYMACLWKYSSSDEAYIGIAITLKALKGVKRQP